MHAYAAATRLSPRALQHGRAFSLVELSIVLVILGLLTGGILAGQSLIRAAELRSIVADYQRYVTARTAFQDKYMSLPGDFRDATRFWGRISGAWCTSYAGVTAGTDGTCDGNGDGIIDRAPAASQGGELFQFWNQLARAGLIEGHYTGIAGAENSADHDFGTNAPLSRIANAGWGASYTNNSAGGETAVFARDYRNSLTFGGDDSIWADTPVLKVEEAWNIDQKLDDGMPATGKLNAYPRTSQCTNAASNTDWGASYSLTATASNGCALVFIQ